ncbi:hypothetical protein C1637_13175 [Chryseobacterium lactis]|uniref:Polysaccharide lyase family 7 protein n=1 Tax=Chryseobacterium lactis TaxID=1241981 RepID=A0A3G6RK84_CHRLC|nr:polysaccharide lyase family 7 protein [Chryseobacterium lactis]AZA83917.1 polysaccharide lyase family 7 protein [Chryseobacterium lactis]AZB04303.1 polysaccharide lyase family 7 protein [Chryseobacterium lactis]PNW12785.1 hypothetical protein C1637_13175 [Chryseobacterium lactis]
MKNRFRNLIITGLLIISGSIDAQKNYSTVPADKFNLNAFNLQLPVEKNNSITIIKGAQIANFSSENFYFSPQDNSIRFFCTSDGKTTQGSHYPRTELRQTDEWHFDKQHILQVKMAVLTQPSTGKIIIGQIHGNSKGTEALKIWWNNGDLQVGYKKEINDKEQRITLLKNVALGQIFNYTIQQSNLEIQVKINQKIVTFDLGNSWKSESVYFKAGNYLQDNKQPVTSGMTAVYQISITK